MTVPGGSAAGDTLTLTITKPDGSTDTVEHTLTADEVTAGKADVTIPADKVTADGNYSVTAEITDPAGNTSGQGKFDKDKFVGNKFEQRLRWPVGRVSG
ncbi:Ig-like domain-containing protein [Proteus mirabilis]|nr:Ig-like domain-containing protein [Proteus mirabilis]UXJ01451.1 Ig-like domain-containing protein [Proteus mirabilis]